MPEEKKYAIRCTTEEQARECREKGLPSFINYSGYGIYFHMMKGYTIITYDEALSLGLIGEKKCNHGQLESCSNCVKINSLQLEPQNVCKSCLGKKQNSVFKNNIYTDDFTGGHRSLGGPTIEMVNCSRCKGTGLEPEYVKEQFEQAYKELVEPVQESPSEDIVEKILNELGGYILTYEQEEDTRNILKKHLSSK